jgi:hypothetical protein
MLDPLSAIGLAGNIVQFVDFSAQLVGKARDIHNSTSGTLPGNIDTEAITRSLLQLNTKLRDRVLEPNSTEEKVIQVLCRGCDAVANELIIALDALKVQGKKTRWKSVRQALKSVAGKEKIESLSKRLAGYREQLTLSFFVALRYEVRTCCVDNESLIYDEVTMSILLLLQARRVSRTSRVPRRRSLPRSSRIERSSSLLLRFRQQC